MKKRTNVNPRWRWRTGGYLLAGAAVVLIALIKLQMLAVRDSPDLPEFPVASYEIPQVTNTTKPKLAFMFIARCHMPLDILWEHFFEGSEEHEYSVYIHSRPGFIFTSQNTICRSFINRQLQNSVQVEWGEPTMIQAERLLIAEALQDPLNERFFLLSDSCIPLYNFKYVYDYVMSSQKSFVDSFYDAEDWQYNILMEPIILREKWRKGSQWVTLTRKHAEIVAADSTVFPTFVHHCKCFYCKIGAYQTWSGSVAKWLQLVALRNVKNDSVNNSTVSNHNCIPDEHYIQTLLAIEGEEGELERRTLTYSRWENSGADWHPATFDHDATVQTIEEIQDIMSVRYDTESRTEWCHTAGNPRRCFLFARKFTKAAAFQLIDEVERYENRP
ncbi:hypothetical protein M758_2G129200 [Ceratodon purpureus]|nr:hypothetical protein M758_2G129200 [Ceratodon purpureus]